MQHIRTSTKQYLLAQEIATLKLTGKSYAAVLRESGKNLDPSFEEGHELRLDLASFYADWRVL